MPTCSRRPCRAARPARPAGAERQASAQAQRRAGEPGNRLDQAAGDRLVWWRDPAGRNRLRHRGLVPCRPAAGAAPLGAGARSVRPARAAGLPQHQPRRHTGGDPGLLRLALARRDDVSGSPPPSRRRDPAAMVGPGHPAHHAGAARVVLAGDAVGRRVDGRRRLPPCARAGPPGMPSRSPPSATPSPPSAGHFGAHRIFRCPGQARTSSKFPRLSCRVSSRPCATPPDDSSCPFHGTLPNRYAQETDGGKPS